MKSFDRSSVRNYLLRMDTPKDLITATEAHRLIGTSPNKIAELIRNGTLKTYRSPLDRRKKLVSKAQVLKLKEPTASAA